MKKHKGKNLLVLVLCLTMVISMSACNSGSDSGNSSSGEPGGPYHIGYDQLGTDWILQDFQQKSENVVKVHNPENKFEAVVADYSTDKMQSGIQSLISGGIDGLMYYAIYATLTPTVQEMCESSGTVFGFAHSPPLPDQYAALQASKVFAGYLGSEMFQIGYQMGERALADGGKVAVLIAGPVGTYDMDEKQRGFTEAFEKGGGKVVAEAHCNFPTEAVEKSSDMLAAHPDVDTAYAATGVFGIGMISALANHKRSDVNLYCSDLDSDLLKEVRSGVIKAGDGGNVVNTVLVTTLVMNMLDGHQILDDSGKPPMNEDMTTLIIDKDNADLYEQVFIKESPFTDAMIEKFLFKTNPDVSWDDYKEFIDNFSLEWFADQRK